MLYRLFRCAVLIICMIFDDPFISVVGMRGLWISVHDCLLDCVRIRSYCLLSLNSVISSAFFNHIAFCIFFPYVVSPPQPYSEIMCCAITEPRNQAVVSLPQISVPSTPP